jgi:hypothetical protein
MQFVFAPITARDPADALVFLEEFGELWMSASIRGTFTRRDHSAGRCGGVPIRCDAIRSYSDIG